MMRRGPAFRPLAARGRRTIVAILVLFALLSSVSIVLSTRATGRSKNRATVIQVAARQRTLAERYVNDVILIRAGRAADPAYTAGLLQKSARVLLDGGVAPGVNGDDDETQLPAETDPIARGQLKQGQRLVADLVATGSALLEGRSVRTVLLTAREMPNVSWRAMRSAMLRSVRAAMVRAALSDTFSVSAATIRSRWSGSVTVTSRWCGASGLPSGSGIRRRT